jgi:hypothetical protein
MNEPIRINMTAKEAKSGPMDPLPNGKYLVAITDIEVAEVQNAPKPGKKDNRGEKYYKIELTVQEGEYDGRLIWTNAMLFDGALYSISGMLKAVGVDIDPSTGWFQVPGFEECVVPDADWWMAKQFVVRTLIKKGEVKDKETEERYPDRPEVKGFYPASSWRGAPAPSNKSNSASNSLLP